MNQHSTDLNLNDDEIDFFELLETLLSRWRWIVGLTLSGALLSAAGWLLLMPYKSSVMLLDRPLAGARVSSARDNSARDNSARDNSARDNSARDGVLTFVGWRRLQPVLNTKAQDGWQQAKKSGDVDRIAAFGPLATPEGLGKVLEPQYAADKAALKNLGAIDGVNASDVLAVRVTDSDWDADRLLRVLSLRAEFVQQVVLGDLYRVLQDNFDASLRSDAAMLRQERAEMLVKQRGVSEKLSALKGLQRTLPDLSRVTSAPVLDPKGDNAKYLPLAVQMMALETDSQDLASKLRDNQEALAALTVRESVVAVMRKHADDALASKYEAMRALRRQLQAENQSPGTMRDLEYQNIDQQLAGLINAKTFGLTLDTPLAPARGKLLTTVILGALASGFAAVLGVFLVAAWQKRRPS